MRAQLDMIICLGFPRAIGRLPLPTSNSPMTGTSHLSARSLSSRKENEMPHKDEVKGKAKETRGHVKEAAGKMTGDEKLRTDGAADKAEGKVQKGIGKAKDAARDALKH
jgi:uncharacterized protein YjbJ (UPF0337 family)